MRVLIIDPLLKSRRGHPYSYVCVVQTELSRRGIASVILGSSCADNYCKQLKNFRPCLPEIVAGIFETKYLFLKIFFLPWLIVRFGNRLGRALFLDPELRLEQGDLLFFPTLYVFELMGTALLLCRKRKVIIEHNCSVVIGLNFCYIRNHPLLTSIFAAAYKFSCNYLLKGVVSGLTFFSNGDTVRREFAALLKKEIVLFPVPLFPLPCTSLTSKREKGNARVIAYLGGARFNKGFDIFVNIVERLCSAGLMDIFHILAQFDLHKQQQFASETAKIEKCSEKLYLLAKQNPGIKIVEGSLSVDEYYNLLFASDIVVIPYRKDAYTSVNSSVFFETIIAGKVPLVSKDTIMAGELLKVGLGGLTFDINDRQGLVDALVRVDKEYDQYHNRISSYRELIKDSCSLTRLVDDLMRCSR
jgi:glycosyltransferase involved in cell wall biosynthesis